jgi:malate/lactate dehydrogenase
MEFYTYDGVNLVLPDIAGTFGVSQDQASWILTTYISALLFGVPLSIWTARDVGRSDQPALGVTLSLPSVVGRDGVVAVLQPGMAPEERSRLQRSAQSLKSALETIRK